MEKDKLTLTGCAVCLALAVLVSIPVSAVLAWQYFLPSLGKPPYYHLA